MNTVSSDAGFSYFTPFGDKHASSVLEQSLVSHLNTQQFRDLSTPVPQVNQSLATSMSLPPFPVPSPMPSLQFSFSTDPTTLAANVAAMVNFSQLGNPLQPLPAPPLTSRPQPFPTTPFRPIVDQINMDTMVGTSTSKLLEPPANISLPSTSFNIGVLCGEMITPNPIPEPTPLRSRRRRGAAENMPSTSNNTPDWVLKQAETLLPKVFQDVYQASKSKEKSTTSILKEIYRTQPGGQLQPGQVEAEFKRQLRNFALSQVESAKNPRSRSQSDFMRDQPKNGLEFGGEGQDWTLNKAKWAEAARKRRERMTDDEKRDQKTKWAEAARRRYHNLTSDQKRALGLRQAERKKRKLLEASMRAPTAPIIESNEPSTMPIEPLQHQGLISPSVYLLKDATYNPLRFFDSLPQPPSH